MGRIKGCHDLGHESIHSFKSGQKIRFYNLPLKHWRIKGLRVSNKPFPDCIIPYKQSSCKANQLHKNLA